MAHTIKHYSTFSNDEDLSPDHQCVCCLIIANFQTYLSIMRWLISANIILISYEGVKGSQTPAAFVGSRPSHTPVIRQSAQVVANPKIGITTPGQSEKESIFKQRTSLSMGIRNILGLGKKPKDDDGKSDNPEDIKAALEAIKADLEAVTKEEAKAKAKPAPEKNKVQTTSKIKIPDVTKRNKVTSNNNRRRQEPSEPTSADTYGESVRDRINRVKSGHMTDEEKAAFLNSALTRTPPSSKGPPIRQKLPNESSSSSRRSSSASPFPKDALWNTLTSNGQSSKSGKSTARYGNINLTGNDDSAKRDYLNMVTNPDRFKSYAAMGGYRSSTASSSNVRPDSKGNVVDNLNMLDSMLDDDTDLDLASRLETAAIQKERMDAEAKAKRDEEERATKAKMQEEQQKRTEELRRMEQEKIAAKRTEEERRMKAEQDANEAEEKRLADLQAAQDAYWAKKLEEEKSRKESQLGKVEIELLEEKKRLEAEARLANAAKEAAKKAEIEQLREEERNREDPHESLVLKEVSFFNFF